MIWRESCKLFVDFPCHYFWWWWNWTDRFLIYSDQGHKEVSLAGVLSPVSKKKTGRAYVSLARAYSEK